jgi:hypothetical protein
MKKCSRCQKTKPFQDFHKSSDRKDGYSYKCKPCQAEVRKARYQKNFQSLKLKDIQRRYGINPEQYQKMIADGCEVCGSFDSLCVDHDHSCCPTNFTCGKCVRGILCRRCNMLEGFLGNDIELARSLIGYLKRDRLVFNDF